jgi:hypothetical protein
MLSLVLSVPSTDSPPSAPFSLAITDVSKELGGSETQLRWQSSSNDVIVLARSEIMRAGKSRGQSAVVPWRGGAGSHRNSTKASGSVSSGDGRATKRTNRTFKIVPPNYRKDNSVSLLPMAQGVHKKPWSDLSQSLQSVFCYRVVSFVLSLNEAVAGSIYITYL